MNKRWLIIGIVLMSVFFLSCEYGKADGIVGSGREYSRHCHDDRHTSHHERCSSYCDGNHCRYYHEDCRFCRAQEDGSCCGRHEDADEHCRYSCNRHHHEGRHHGNHRGCRR